MGTVYKLVFQKQHSDVKGEGGRLIVWQSAQGSGLTPIPHLSPLQIYCSSNQIAERHGNLKRNLVDTS